MRAMKFLFLALALILPLGGFTPVGVSNPILKAAIVGRDLQPGSSEDTEK